MENQINQPVSQGNIQQPYQTSPAMQPKLQNAVATLVLGLLSLLTNCGGVGLVLGIIGLIISNKDEQRLRMTADPLYYSNAGMHKAGRIMSIIGIVLGAIFLVIGIISAVALGGSFFFFEEILDILDL